MENVLFLNQKRYEKRIIFERKVLKDISLKQVKTKTRSFFSPFFIQLIPENTLAEETIDIAIEAYLLGACMSRYGYLGEQVEQVKCRCKKEWQELQNDLYFQLVESGLNTQEQAPLYAVCKDFINYWWLEGFEKGQKRYKLRLH